MSSTPPPDPKKYWGDMQTSLLLYLIFDIGVLLAPFYYVSRWLFWWFFWNWPSLMGWWEYLFAAASAYFAAMGFGQLACVVSKQPKYLYDPFFLDTAPAWDNMMSFQLMVFVCPYFSNWYFPFSLVPWCIVGLGVMGLLGYLDGSAAKPPAWLRIKGAKNLNSFFLPKQDLKIYLTSSFYLFLL